MTTTRPGEPTPSNVSDPPGRVAGPCGNHEPGIYLAPCTCTLDADHPGDHEDEHCGGTWPREAVSA